MQAVVKTPHTEIIIKGTISENVLGLLKNEYGSSLEIIEDDIPVNVCDTEWYQTVKANMTPGDYIRALRDKNGWTQKKLGEMLGGIRKQVISNMERGVRPISMKMAHKLAEVFKTDTACFIRHGTTVPF